jgi:hypothetical protein
MTNTTYINASGLPADEQITTARDQALTKKRVFDAMDSGLAVFLAGAQHRTVGASALALLPHEA